MTLQESASRLATSVPLPARVSVIVFIICLPIVCIAGFFRPANYGEPHGHVSSTVSGMVRKASAVAYGQKTQELPPHRQRDRANYALGLMYAAKAMCHGDEDELQRVSGAEAAGVFTTLRRLAQKEAEE